MKESPAPTVSTTVVRAAGTSTPRGPVARVRAQGPRGPRVTTTSSAPALSQAPALSSTLRWGYSHRRSSSEAFTTSARATSCSARARASEESGMMDGRQLGS